ncbi:hypothetical protein KPL78_02485 [Roseomonas sp. HJA6]|uniref:Uncharacterized protein n=1 Tax=Roseomonas alba TaxID=2846776 RepID=A0ABS7A4P4_9PROT|nr:hypothetical protein [Neoroseomonas alba]MBW6396692.1 hypothetical protein [Neoroseomonas alba]
MTKTLPALPATDAKPAAEAGTLRLGGLSPLFPPAAADAGTLRLGGLSPLFADAGRLRMGGLSPLFGRS